MKLVVMIGGICNELGALGEQLLSSWDAGRGQWGRPFDNFLRSISRKKGKDNAGHALSSSQKSGMAAATKKSGQL